MNYTTGKFFLDTNFLIYLFSKDEPEKRDRCRTILKEGSGQAVFTISTQVLKEFTSVMIGKYNADPKKVKSIVANLLEFEVVQVNAELILKSIDLHIIHKYSFWDSLIIAAAQAAACNVLLTEDLQHQQEIFGLKIFNPFL